MRLVRGLVSLLVIYSIVAFSFQFSSAQLTNSAPILDPIGYNSEDERSSAELTISASDPNPNDILTFFSSTLPNFVILENNGDRTAKLVFETSCNDAGIYSITITVTDNGNPKLSDTETFTLEILEDCDSPSAEILMEDAVDQIIEMTEDGKFTAGQASSLIAKIEAAASKLDQDNISAAFPILRSLINQIEAFIQSGVLTNQDGQPLIDKIQQIIALL
ncbi:MAG TPA: cadherin repeat domain-containing protein [Nitrosopumilaceae archaeon]|nr:cadherin repeat domain-containing protein [Nitrosopumilaceae archaeon]